MPIPSPAKEQDLSADVITVSLIDAVPTILDVVCHSTGMRFAAVARVTEERWVACSVLDRLDFGLTPGGELPIETTICNKIRRSRVPVVIDHVAEDAAWCDHRTPAMYGFQSYISMPIVLGDGSFFGTLCAIDPEPVRVNTPQTIGMFRLFADLIAKHLDAQRKLAEAEFALHEERALAELREQFIAVLGHDLRAPACAVTSLVKLLLQTPLREDAVKMGTLIRSSSVRMVGLIDNLTDLARSRLGGGLAMNLEPDPSLGKVLSDVVAELSVTNPERIVDAVFSLRQPVACDSVRVAQLFSNLLGNALNYGAPDEPVSVVASSGEGRFTLSVVNTGQPIPPESLGRLFQPFYRRETMQNREGLGLGLYIADQIAKAHGGTLTAESGRTETRFTFRMPIV